MLACIFQMHSVQSADAIGTPVGMTLRVIFSLALVACAIVNILSRLHSKIDILQRICKSRVEQKIVVEKRRVPMEACHTKSERYWTKIAFLSSASLGVATEWRAKESE